MNLNTMNKRVNEEVQDICVYTTRTREWKCTENLFWVSIKDVLLGRHLERDFTERWPIKYCTGKLLYLRIIDVIKIMTSARSAMIPGCFFFLRHYYDVINHIKSRIHKNADARDDGLMLPRMRAEYSKINLELINQSIISMGIFRWP